MALDWDKLVNTVLLGTDRGQISSDLKAEVEALLGFPLEEDPSEALLQGTALFSFLRKTSLPQKTDPDGILTGKLPPEEDRQPCSNALARHLGTMLSGDFEPFLHEALEQVVQKRLLLPPECLPDIWEKALEDDNLKSLFFDRLAPGDAWLARKHPRWRLLAPLPVEQGETLKLELRLAALQAWRHRQGDPGPLLSDWESLEAREKTVILHSFQPPLRPEEAHFLASCLKDRRKEVRHNAAKALLLDEKTSLAKDWEKLVREILLVKKDAFVLKSEGKKGEDWRRLGLWHDNPIDRMNFLASNSSVGLWSRCYGEPLGAILQRAKNSRFGKAWIKGFTEAVLRQKDSTAAADLLRFEKKGPLDMPGSVRRALIGLLDKEDFLHLLSEELSLYAGLIPESSLATQLLLGGRYVWPSGLVRTVLGSFRDWLFTAETVDWDAWHYRKILRMAGYRIPAESLGIWEKGWPDYGYIWDRWKPEVVFFQRILRFRRQFYQDLSDCTG